MHNQDKDSIFADTNVVADTTQRTCYCVVWGMIFGGIDLYKTFLQVAVVDERQPFDEYKSGEQI